MAHSSRLTAHSSQLTAHSSQLTAHSSRLTAHGSQSRVVYSKIFFTKMMIMAIGATYFIMK